MKIALRRIGSALQTSAPYELGWPRTAIHANFGALYPVYVRGEAYLAARRQECRGRISKDYRSPRHRGPRYRRRACASATCARAYAMSGDTANTRAKYRDFVTLWKDADPDIPLLKQAKSEYANLK